MIKRYTPLKRSTKPIARVAIKHNIKPHAKPDRPLRYYEAPKPAVRVYDDGREVCDLSTTEGKAEYRSRKEKMCVRQNWICCMYGYIKECPGRIRKIQDASFDHEHGRGAGKQDDRIEVEGRRQNGACHYLCNSIKGSRYFPYNEGKHETA